MFTARKTLELDKVLQITSKYAYTSLSKQRILELDVSNDIDSIRTWLIEVDEAKRIIERLDSAPLAGVFDCRETLKLAKIGSTIPAKELIKILGLLQAVRSNKSHLSTLTNFDMSIDYYAHYVEKLVSLPALYKQISTSIDENGNILDSASQALYSIRRKIKVLENRIRDKVKSVAETHKSQLTSQIVTIRNNRLVLPVKAEYKNSFPGVIHDYSASGETVYMEPNSAAKSNNELNAAIAEERNEVERILQELSQSVSVYYEDLMSNLNTLIQIDVVFAKARFALENHGVMPQLNDEGIIKLLDAYHPLIEREDCVANNIIVGKDYKGIIITGPNTGGKTVALKTCGLLTLMVQCGLMIPVDEQSNVAVFDNIFADIGDEQSIEQSLSTFSSHMKNIITIVDNVTVNSLVLVDELGSGTDPKEGASLAKSILDFLLIRGVRIIATTHYTELKAYAYLRDDLVNASVEFDVDTLSPTYRLLIGIPGQSNAFLISERLGLKTEIIKASRENVATQQTEVSELIIKLEKQGLLFEEMIQQAKQEKEKYKVLSKELEQKSYDLESRRTKEFNQAKEDAYKIIKSAQSDAKRIIEELKASKNEKDHVLTEKQYELKQLIDKYTSSEQKKADDNRILKPGDQVMVLSFNRIATVTKVHSLSKIEVKMGRLTSVFKRNELQYIVAEKREDKPASKKKVSIKKTTKVGMELDLRGERYEEAMVRLERFLDQAMLENMPKLYVIHGHGTGVLREGVQNFLKNNPYIKEYRYGVAGEGGNGVTVITLK